MAVLFLREGFNQLGAMAGVGYEDAFPRPKLSARSRFSQRTFAGTHGNGRGAPKRSAAAARPARYTPCL